MFPPPAVRPVQRRFCCEFSVTHVYLKCNQKTHNNRRSEVKQSSLVLSCLSTSILHRDDYAARAHFKTRVAFPLHSRRQSGGCSSFFPRVFLFSPRHASTLKGKVSGIFIPVCVFSTTVIHQVVLSTGRPGHGV